MSERSDTDTTVGELKQAMREFAKEREWLQFHSPKNLSMAIAIEAGELMEHFLWCEPAEAERLMQQDEVRDAVGDEMADVALFLLQMATVAGIDLTTVVKAKLAKNQQKYPVEKARGRSEKYDQL